MSRTNIDRNFESMNDITNKRIAEFDKVISEETGKIQQALEETNRKNTLLGDRLINKLAVCDHIDNIVQECTEKIVARFEALGEEQINLNGRFNKQLIEGQEKYIENLNGMLTNSIDVVGEILQTTRDESIRSLQKLKDEIEQTK